MLGHTLIPSFTAMAFVFGVPQARSIKFNACFICMATRPMRPIPAFRDRVHVQREVQQATNRANVSEDLNQDHKPKAIAMFDYEVSSAVCSHPAGFSVPWPE